MRDGMSVASLSAGGADDYVRLDHWDDGAAASGASTWVESHVNRGARRRADARCRHSPASRDEHAAGHAHDDGVRGGGATGTSAAATTPAPGAVCRISPQRAACSEGAGTADGAPRT